MRKSAKVALVAAMVAGGTLVAAPASAGSASWGTTLSCAQGGVFSRAMATHNVTHEHLYNGVRRSKLYINGSTFKTNTYYPSWSTVHGTSIQNGTGGLMNAVRNCAD